LGLGRVGIRARVGLGLGLEPVGALERVHGDQYIADQGVDLVHLVWGRVRVG
jgi:hypothetical protein